MRSPHLLQQWRPLAPSGAVHRCSSTRCPRPLRPRSRGSCKRRPAGPGQGRTWVLDPVLTCHLVLERGSLVLQGLQDQVPFDRSLHQLLGPRQPRSHRLLSLLQGSTALMELHPFSSSNSSSRHARRGHSPLDDLGPSCRRRRLVVGARQQGRCSAPRQSRSMCRWGRRRHSAGWARGRPHRSLVPLVGRCRPSSKRTCIRHPSSRRTSSPDRAWRHGLLAPAWASQTAGTMVLQVLGSPRRSSRCRTAPSQRQIRGTPTATALRQAAQPLLPVWPRGGTTRGRRCRCLQSRCLRRGGGAITPSPRRPTPRSWSGTRGLQGHTTFAAA